MKRSSLYIAVLSVILALFALGALFRLGDTALWQDEAETALLSRTTAKHGLPTVDLGESILFEGGHHYNDDHVWTWQSWLSYYLGAMSFWIFGESAWSARLPFALAAILCVAFTALLGWRFTGSRGVGVLSAFLLAANVPFLLYARQCRNYALAALLVTLLLLAYRRFLRKERHGSILLAAMLVLLFHCHLLVFGGVLAGLLLHYAAMRVRAIRDVEILLVPLLIALLFTLPWFLYAGGFVRPGQLAPEAFVSNGVRFLAWINNYLFPFAFLAIPAIAFFIRPGRPEESRRDDFLSVLILVPLGAVLAWCFCSQVFFRYLVVWIPVAAILLAACLKRLWAFPLTGVRFICPGILVPLILTNLWSVGPTQLLGPALAEHFEELAASSRSGDDRLLAMQRVKTANVLLRRTALEHPFGEAGVNLCLWMEMLSEYAEPPRGAMDAIVEHLLEHAHPGDLVWTGYGDLPILFHTDTRVVSWYMTCLKPNSYQDADWIIPRGPAPFYLMLDGRLRLAGAGKFTKGFHSFLDVHFERVVLPVTDILCGNCPDPDVHQFRRPVETPHVVLFQRVGEDR